MEGCGPRAGAHECGARARGGGARGAARGEAAPRAGALLPRRGFIFWVCANDF